MGALQNCVKRLSCAKTELEKAEKIKIATRQKTQLINFALFILNFNVIIFYYYLLF